MNEQEFLEHLEKKRLESVRREMEMLKRISDAMSDDDSNDHDDDYSLYDYEDMESPCYMTRFGICGAAGSEYCDWECPLYGINAGESEETGNE